MPTAKKKSIVILLPNQKVMKNSIRYEEEDGAAQALANIYLKNKGVEALGAPAGLKVTIEPLNAAE